MVVCAMKTVPAVYTAGSTRKRATADCPNSGSMAAFPRWKKNSVTGIRQRETEQGKNMRERVFSSGVGMGLPVTVKYP